MTPKYTSTEYTYVIVFTIKTPEHFRNGDGVTDSYRYDYGDHGLQLPRLEMCPHQSPMVS